MTVTVLDRRPVADDAGGVTGERPKRLDPEVPEPARRRTFTAQYRLEFLAAYDAAGRVRRARSCAGRPCIPVTSWTGGDPGTLVCWPAWQGLAAAAADPRDAQTARLRKEKPIWSRSWPSPASWSMCSQNCRRSWRRSPRARTPGRCRVRDPMRRSPYRRRGSAPGGLRGLRRAACDLVPAAPDQPAAAAAGPVRAYRAVQPRALGTAERTAILDVLHTGQFADLAPDEVWATLLDEDAYVGSVSIFCRVLCEAGNGAQATHPAAVKPELVADGPDQVYSWDTQLHGPAKLSAIK